MLEALRKSVVDRVGFSARYWLTLSALCVSFAFGGGTRQWLPSEFICQVFGLIFLAAGLLQLMNCDSPSKLRFEIGLAGGIVLLPAVQLVPLPPFLWSMLPGRGFLVEEFHTVRGSLPWLPISLSRDATWQALLSLSLPLSVFVFSLLLTFQERRTISLAVLAFAGLSVAVAFLQQLQGADSPLRFYTITNISLPVGFFANRNHFAAFLYCAIPMSVAWTIALGLKVKRSRRTGEFDAKNLVFYLIAATGFVALLLTEGLVHSRAGLIITVLASILSLSLVIPYRKTEAGEKAIKALLLIFVIAVILVGYYALYNIVQQFDRDPIEDARFTIVKGALRALWAFFPVGSGFGTFDLVYRQFELPGSATAENVNRAHDDVLETIMEGGIFTIALMIIFFVWLARRTWRVWTSPQFRDASTIDLSLARASAFVPLLLLVHSFLDYPLRTQAVMSLFAFSCTLIVPPINRESDEASSDRSSSDRSTGAHRTRTKSGGSRPRPAT